MNIIIIQEHNDILPFSWISEKGVAGEESTLNFTIESGSSQYFSYLTSDSLSNNESDVYVPNKEESYYKHENSFYIDVIAKDANGIKEVRTHVTSDAYDFKKASDAEVFFIPKFTWR